MRIAKLPFLALAFVGLGALTLAAQNDNVPTYHAYPDLVQTAVVVLDQDLKPLPPISENRFFVSLDGGPRFRVTHARPEGSDPISLAILLDLNQPFPTLIKNIDNAIASLAPLSLSARDSVSIYSLDCQFIQPGAIVPADPSALRQAVNDSLSSWEARGQKHLTRCQDPSNLRDALALITQRLRQQSGHRVLLVLSDGSDHGSHNSWNDVKLSAQSGGIAIFGVTEAYSQVAFVSVCNATGGMVFNTTRQGLAAQLQRFVSILRGRYIVEFPHAVTTTAAYHNMEITVDKTNAYIRTSGILVPVDDPTILNDPMTIHPDPSYAPKLGKTPAPPPH